MEHSLNITFVGEEGEGGTSDEDNWLNLVQELLGKYAPFANFQDAYQMLMRAMGGQSARTYNLSSCKNISVSASSITLKIPFYVYPSDMELPYTVRAVTGAEGAEEDVGHLLPRIREQTFVVDSFVIEMTDTIEFDYLIILNSLIFETPCYNRLGEAIPPPAYEVVKNKIKFERKFFAVTRISLYALGYKHRLHYIIRRDPGELGALKHKISLNDSIVIKAEYEGGEETLTLNLEQAQKALDNCLPQCEDGSLLGGGSLNINPGGEERSFYTVYYDTCREDEVIEIREKTVSNE